MIPEGIFLVVVLEADPEWQTIVKLALDANFPVVVHVCKEFSRVRSLKPEAVDLAIIGDLDSEQMPKALEWAQERQANGRLTIFLSDICRVRGSNFLTKAKFGDGRRFLEEVKQFLPVAPREAEA